jgi:archaetidylinositol phosphate synthase
MLDKILGENPDVRRLQSSTASALAQVGISANLATAAALAAGIGAGIAFAAKSAGWGILLLAISAVLDTLDGTLARERGQPTLLGGISDLVADRVVESAVIIGIAWPYPALYLPALTLVASWYVNITVFVAVGAALERRGPELIDYTRGILERTEALIFFVMLGAIQSVPFLHPLGPLLCYAMVALEVATAAQRFRFGWRMLKREAP